MAYDLGMRYLAVITLALLVLTGCQTPDYAAELKRIRPLAEQGDAKAQTRIGVMYRWGDGVKRCSIFRFTKPLRHDTNLT